MVTRWFLPEVDAVVIRRVCQRALFRVELCTQGPELREHCRRQHVELRDALLGALGQGQEKG